MSRVFAHVMDGLDIETFLVCKSEEEGRGLAITLMKDLGFEDIDIVFIQYQGPGVRVRVRAYIHRSGDTYGWLDPDKYQEEEEN